MVTAVIVISLMIIMLLLPIKISVIYSDDKLIVKAGIFTDLFTVFDSGAKKKKKTSLWQLYQIEALIPMDFSLHVIL